MIPRIPSHSAADAYPLDFTPDEESICRAVRPYTMTSPERIVSLTRAVEHIVRHGVPGDIVECGVWRGGSMMAVAHALRRLGVADRTLHLFDTFAGMPPPSGRDYAPPLGRSAAEDPALSYAWAIASLELVTSNMRSTGYPAELVRYVAGRVEETNPAAAPDRIARLRLDTDWYESTRHELVHLFSQLVPGGVLVIDDYGHWAGARQAVDEYLAEQQLPLLLCRIDYTGRIAVKP